MANTHKDNNTIRSEQAKSFRETRRTLMIIQLIVRGSELSASACAAATGLGMAAAGGRMTLDLAMRFSAVGENVAVLHEL